MRVSALLALFLLLVACNTSAQLVDLDPDWKEVDVPAPPAFRTDRLIQLEMPPYVSLKIGIDPQTMHITRDGIVRYVIVASSPSGNINASYEGIRCQTGEVKTYARHGATGQWTPVTDPQWKPLNANQPSMHALAFARQGACEGRSSASQSPQAIIRKLKHRPLDNQ